MSRNDSSALVGQTIAGKFVVEGLIAVGGSGTVYRARQLALERMVALKVLREEFSRDEGFIERFKREARAASRLDHPNSVRVLDFGQDGDSLVYLAMEYVEGRNLYQVIREDWPLSDERIVDIMSQVLSAVGVAHEMGVIHRDLKPENVIIIRARGEEGETAEIAKVCDFGIASLVSAARGEAPGTEAPRMTKRGVLVGTPQYMSPEQARGEPADRRGDVYSAGVVLYQLLTRRLPFDGESALMVAVKHVTEAPPPPSRFARVNPRLEAICLKALNKAPDERYATAREMRAALRGALAGSGAVGLETPPHLLGAVGPVDTLSAAAVGPPARAPWRRSLFVGVALALVVAGSLTARSLLRPQGGVGEGLEQARSHGEPAGARAHAATPELAATAAAAPVPSRPADAVPLARALPSVTASASERAPPDAAPPSVGARRSRATAARQKSEARRAAAAAATSGAGATVSRAAPPEPAIPTSTSGKPVDAPSSSSVAPARPADVDRATVSITGVITSSAIPGSNIRAAVNRTPILRCYRDALRAHGRAAAGTAVVNLHIDSAGYVTSAAVRDAQFLPAIKPCVERAVRAAKVRDVDTGEATADVTLSFVCPS